MAFKTNNRPQRSERTRIQNERRQEKLCPTSAPLRQREVFK